MLDEDFRLWKNFTVLEYNNESWSSCRSEDSCPPSDTADQVRKMAKSNRVFMNYFVLAWEKMVNTVANPYDLTLPRVGSTYVLCTVYRVGFSLQASQSASLNVVLVLVIVIVLVVLVTNYKIILFRSKHVPTRKR